jgi:hypothetical protein
LGRGVWIRLADPHREIPKNKRDKKLNRQKYKLINK